jgi:hypothetical protein
VMLMALQTRSSHPNSHKRPTKQLLHFQPVRLAGKIDARVKADPLSPVDGQ